MKTSILLIITLLSIFSCVRSGPKVIELIDDNFYDYIRKNKNVLVLFFDKKTTNGPEIEEYASELVQKHQPKGETWHFAKFNAHKYHHFDKVIHVHQFPRLRFYYDNEFYSTLDMAPTKGDLDSFLTEKAKPSPSAIEVQNESQINELKASRLAILLTFPQFDDKNLYFVNYLQKTFPKIQVYFGYKGSVVHQQYFDSDSQDFGIVLVRKFDEGDKKISEASLFNVQTILNFIHNFGHEKIQILDKLGYDKILSHHHPFIIIFDNKHDSANVQVAKDYLYRLNYQGLIFVSDLNEEGFSKPLGGLLGIKQSEFPALMIVRNHDDRYQKYKYTGKFTTQELQNFTTKFFKGEIPEYFRSQNVVNKPDAKILELSGDNFQSTIKGSKSHFVVLFYKEHDTRSEHFIFAFKEAYKLLHSSNDIVFAKVNIDVNDVNKINVKKGAQVQFYNNDNKRDPIQYSAPLKSDVFIQFLSEQLNKQIERRTEYEIGQITDL